MQTRDLAFVGFVLTAVAVVLPWWRIVLESDGSEAVNTFRPFRPFDPVTTWAPYLTGGLLAAGTALIGFRLAARSWEHEPPIWRRDVVIATVLAGTALASALLWPASVPFFWGSQTFIDERTGATITQTARPAIGWWLCAASTLTLAFSARHADATRK